MGHAERFTLDTPHVGDPDAAPVWPMFAVGELVHVLERDGNNRPACRAAVVIETADGDETAPPMLRCRVLRPTNAVGTPVGWWDSEQWYGYRVPSSQGFGCHRIGDCL